jgi:hypothetical protein
MKDRLSFDGLSDAKVHPDGETLSLTINRADGQSLNISCDRSDLAQIISDLIELAAAGGQTTEDRGEFQTQNLLTPAPTLGIGFHPGEVPDCSLLVVRTGGLDLSFEISNSDLADAAEQFARTAKALSAPTARKN